MKIHAIKNVSFVNNATNNPIKNAQNSELKESTVLQGIPKSYISFSGLDEEKRRHQIAEYLKYRDLADEYAQGDTLYKKKVEDRIERLIHERSHYGRFSGEYKIGKVKKLERLNIEKEEFELFLAEKDKCQKIMANESYYKGLLSTDDIEIYDKVKKILSTHKSINKELAGYNEVKEEVRKLIVNPIQREAVLGTTEKIPPALLLYGPIGCGKTKLPKAMCQEAGCHYVEMSKTLSPRKFTGELNNLLNQAREYYKSQSNANEKMRNSEAYRNASNEKKARMLTDQKSPRTIILVDEVDRYFDPNTYGNSEDIADMNKTLLKGVLDHCSEKPSRLFDSDAAGVTFVFTTNYPTRVDSEISMRNGKCTRLPISVPNDEDIKDIMKFYIEDYTNPKIFEAIEGGAEREMIDVEQFPFDSYKQITKPDPKKGALAGDGIEQAVKQATSRYIDNPDSYINIQLAQMLSGGKYRIPPGKLEEYLKEITSMGKRYREIDEKEEYELLSDLQKLDMISENQITRLEYLKDIYNNKENGTKNENNK